MFQLNAQISNRTVHPCATEQELDRAQIACHTIDLSDLRPAVVQRHLHTALTRKCAHSSGANQFSRPNCFWSDRYWDRIGAEGSSRSASEELSISEDCARSHHFEAAGPQPIPAPLMARKKYQEIAEHLELLILSGRVKPGDRLPAERQLMEQFDAGRSSVREALFSLQRQGLLTSRPGAVPRVSAPTAEVIFAELSGTVRHYLSRPEGLRDLQDARALFEIGLARRAAQIATDDDIGLLGAALDANRAADDLETFAETDVAFHLAMARISKNAVFEGLNTALASWLRDQRVRSAAAGATFEDVIAQHQAVFEAIAAREPEKAAQAMEEHLDKVVSLYWQAVLS